MMPLFLGVADIQIQSNLYIKATQGNLKMWPFGYLKDFSSDTYRQERGNSGGLHKTLI
jgi:hypothetical protein